MLSAVCVFCLFFVFCFLFFFKPLFTGLYTRGDGRKEGPERYIAVLRCGSEQPSVVTPRHGADTGAVLLQESQWTVGRGPFVNSDPPIPPGRREYSTAVPGSSAVVAAQGESLHARLVEGD